MRGVPEPLPIDYGKPGYEGREARRANRRRAERFLSQHGNIHHRKVVRRRRMAEHWTRRAINGT